MELAIGVVENGPRGKAKAVMQGSAPWAGIGYVIDNPQGLAHGSCHLFRFAPEDQFCRHVSLPYVNELIKGALQRL